MGLDITAYSKLSKAGADIALDEFGEPEDEDGFVQPFANTHYPERLEGLEDGAFYAFDHSMRFRAGSYGTYGSWRNTLARLAGFTSSQQAWDADGGAFWELIAFSDCEGDIGPVVSAKLAKDFADFEERARFFNSGDDDNWFYQKYTDWKNAFELAADGGMVSFH